MELRWYRKLNDEVVLQRLSHGKWIDLEEASEFDERKHGYGKYHPTEPDQDRYEWE